MRRFAVVFFVFTLMLGVVSAPVYASSCYQDTPINKTGDWFATIGKKGLEKKRILEKRKYERVLPCVQKRRDLQAR
jgi:hypothetical protein